MKNQREEQIKMKILSLVEKSNLNENLNYFKRVTTIQINFLNTKK